METESSLNLLQLGNDLSRLWYVNILKLYIIIKNGKCVKRQMGN